VRVTFLSCTPARPQEAQRCLEEVDRDDVERTRRPELDDGFGFAPIKGAPLDEDFGLTRSAIFLALDDAAREDDVFEIKDREVVIFQFFGGVVSLLLPYSQAVSRSWKWMAERPGRYNRCEVAMSTQKRTKYVHEGKYVAEVDVEPIEDETGWSPYLTVEDACRLDDVRNALRRGDVPTTSKLARIFRLEPVGSN